MKISMIINEKHPELSKYIEEMTVTIPDEKSPVITVGNLQMYCDSLNSLLNKYILERPDKGSKGENWTSLVYANL